MSLVYSRGMKLWKRPSNGVYYAVFQQKGKQHKYSLKVKDKRAAARAFRRFQKEHSDGKIKPISRGQKMPFESFCEEFLDYVESTLEPATYVIYKVALNKARICWGNILLNYITTRHIDTYITDLLRSNLKVPTVNKNLRHLKGALSKAYEWDRLSKRVKFPKPLKEEKKLRYLTGEQIKTILAFIDDSEFADFCLFAAVTGMRSGEIIRLHWKDIDNPKGFIRISPKSKNKVEYRIPINSQAREILNRYKKHLGPVFRFKTETWVSQKFRCYIEKAGFKGHRFHDLRHAFGTALVKAGEDIRTIQKLMRHESIQSTLVYAKVLPEHLIEASNNLDYGFSTDDVNKKKLELKKTGT